jgi:short-subunit dehydrogenase
LTYTKILIAGANSYIASQCIPGLNLGNSEIFLVARDTANLKHLLNQSQVKRLEIKDFKGGDVLTTLTTFLQLNSGDKLLIINFIGSFGTIGSVEDLDLENFGLEVNENLIPFMVLSKLLSRCQSGLFLTFAGAGVGGDKLEVASLSYLASKASIVVLVEGLDNILRRNGVRVGAISPGAFPSRMQEVVANCQNASVVSAERKNQAVKTLQSTVDSGRLMHMLNFLIANPDAAGGRVWSANFDSPQTELGDKNFGKLRRTL